MVWTAAAEVSRRGKVERRKEKGAEAEGPGSD